MARKKKIKNIIIKGRYLKAFQKSIAMKKFEKQKSDLSIQIFS